MYTSIGTNSCCSTLLLYRDRVVLYVFQLPTTQTAFFMSPIIPKTTNQQNERGAGAEERDWKMCALNVVSCG